MSRASRSGRLTAVLTASVAASLGVANPAFADPDPHASLVGRASAALAHDQARDDASEVITMVRKAGDKPLEFSFSDLIVSSGACPPSVCAAAP